MDWSIQDIARLSGTTSRTLRHYGEIGLLAPSRIGSNGYRYYDEAALTRLQRILLLRELGLGLPAISDVLAGQRDDAAALRIHLKWLQQEQQRLARQMESVEKSITAMEGGEQLMAENMFDGFDHTQYKEEVEERWGSAAYATSDGWWSSMSAAEKQAWKAGMAALIADWASAGERGVSPDSDEAQSLAQRQFEWLTGIPGTPQQDGRPTREYFVGLGELYVADERFAKNYGGSTSAAFVRDAMKVYADRNL